ncbi:multidrug ABC transporter ATP-binding protein [Enterococcus ureilyticus]|uniref:Multidrug ABC transporter ATP-binding protein n=1 Tax=Enterococcus ureilyticus TaxID=1131292 RepID=A0A1E5HDV2_9ENTE|nr:ABC transporter ATP-binding protein [Enterococcus ureilyticus]MBM7689854.1 ABC-2 type transport system ATP-binding protein [Enterococcus ureilyticus]MBO0446521.1 ABC transporter ATP-binding protein [Enterococcus ureilyticus]OEG23114.1 multidrug ABC transporter ATP-binding protein [Enterococcus ureilyticus]
MEIKVRDLVMRYGRAEVLNIRSLDFEKGTSYGLVGHNGAGKTTLFKCMTNIIANYQGDISIDGITVKQHNEVLLNVGIVLDGMSVYSNRSGWFNIQYFSGLRGNFDEEKARDLARELDLFAVLDQKVKSYSYGMQKKLILLIALMHTPEVLILDEPFRGLDIDTVKWFKQYLKHLTEQGLTLVISSHVQNDLEALCDIVYVIDRGRISETIDLNAEKEKQIRRIDTTNNDRLKEILDEVNYYYQVDEEGGVKLDISDERWILVKQYLTAESIEISELSKVKILDEKLN